MDRAAFAELLARGPLVTDGGMGTSLVASGVAPDACFELLNANAPEAVEAVHRAFLSAGAGIVLTNTFGASRFGLARFGLADRAVERIGTNSLANFAGDLRARGDGPDGDGWPVGFGSTTILLKDTGAATSGTGGRRWGERSHHLIDPRTGLPAETDLVEVSVLASTGAEAEVLAKTALFLGREAGARFLDERALGSYIV